MAKTKIRANPPKTVDLSFAQIFSTICHRNILISYFSPGPPGHSPGLPTEPGQTERAAGRETPGSLQPGPGGEGGGQTGGSPRSSGEISSTLIGPAPTLLRSHWSRAPEW